jgi:hypothetical protein
MSRPRSERESNVTLRVPSDVLLWARTRALFARTSVNALIRRFLAEYAAVPPSWPEVHDPRPGRDVFAEVMEPVGAGARARERQAEDGMPP